MKKTINSMIIISLFLLSLTGCGIKKERESDALKFKEEYEALNGTSNASGEHRTIEIPKENPFQYATGEEIQKKIENKETFYVYFGSAYCPWCRSVIEKAIESAKENGIETIYYVDIWDGDHVEILRDQYELDSDGNPKLVKEGGAGYQELLTYLDSVLEDYTLSDKSGKSVSVGEKRIFAPNFIYIEDGKAVRLETGISKKQKDARAELTNEILNDEREKLNTFFRR